MSSITATIKGYGKITPNHPPQQPPPPNLHRRRIIAISVTLAVTLTLLLAALTAALVHRSANESESLEALRTVCSRTTYPTTCLTSLNTTTTTDAAGKNTLPTTPLSYLNLSLHVGISQISSIRKDLVNDSSNVVKDCVDLLDQASSELDKCSGLMSTLDLRSKLTDQKTVSDLMTWISAAMTDGETCLDGFDEMGVNTTDVAEIKTKVKKSQEVLSNTLAILNNLGKLYDELDD